MAQPDRVIQLLILKFTFDNMRMMHCRYPIIDLGEAQVEAFIAAVKNIIDPIKKY